MENINLKQTEMFYVAYGHKTWQPNVVHRLARLHL